MSKQRMPQRLRPVVKYLEGVLVNEKAPERLRFQAAERLCDLFLEGERGKRERAIAIARAEARVEAAALAQTAQSTPEPVREPSSAAMNTAVDVKAYLAQFTGK